MRGWTAGTKEVGGWCRDPVRDDGSFGQDRGRKNKEKATDRAQIRVQKIQGVGGGRREEPTKISDHMALPAGPLTHLLALCADLDGIGDQLGCLFLLQTCHFLQLDGNLEGQVRQKGPEPSLP